VLLISNEDVTAAMTMSDCVEAIESVYRELSQGAAAFRPRGVTSVPHGGDRSYTLSTMDGASRASGVAAIRIRSDLVALRNGRQTKYAGSPGNFCGLVLLFDIENAAPLAIFNDGILQQMRVGATAAVAAIRMARSGSSVLGVLGAGGQARAHTRAYSDTFPIDAVRVYSPTPASRETFAREMNAELGVEVLAVDRAEDVFQGVDLVAACTNSTRPVFPAAWLQPGTHLSSVRHWREIGADIVERVDRVVIHQVPEDTRHSLTDVPRTTGTDQTEVDTPIPAKAPTLTDLISGQTIGRVSDSEITYFLNNVGTGIQFAACAGLALRRCQDLGLGLELPTESFLQQISD